MPKRIQRKRTKGWRMPKGAVYVGRPSKWGNPLRVGVDVPSAYDAREKYRFRIGENVWTFPTKEDIQRELRGKTLVCWCPPWQACHADVLLEIANS